ncbi:MAG: enoyl-CoA hydratase-related protein [Candidatus Dormibacteraeota bacterium]|nr:enoyl-CoA hydratase-related protein [Candidatus Dormibacteraeota bacterium]
MSETVATQVVTRSVENGVAWIRLNRPEKRNAVSSELRSALAASVRDSERDPETRVVVVIGNGGAFCAGADVTEFQQRPDAPAAVVEGIRGEYERILLGLRTMPKPTIAAVDGAAAGIGASIAVCCDLRYATTRAFFREAFVDIGLTVDGGISWLLPRLIGSARALEMFYTGSRLGAEEAERLGLVNHVVKPERLEATVRKAAEKIAAGPALALAAMKRSTNLGAATSLEDTIDFEFLLQGALMETEDHREGVAAFLEKRAPRFSGR